MAFQNTLAISGREDPGGLPLMESTPRRVVFVQLFALLANVACTGSFVLTRTALSLTLCGTLSGFLGLIFAPVSLYCCIRCRMFKIAAIPITNSMLAIVWFTHLP